MVVNPGDLVVADDSGVCVVPASAMAKVSQTARLIKTKEMLIARGLRAGLDLASAVAQATAAIRPVARAD